MRYQRYGLREVRLYLIPPKLDPTVFTSTYYIMSSRAEINCPSKIHMSLQCAHPNTSFCIQNVYVVIGARCKPLIVARDGDIGDGLFDETATLIY
jgi:hypothetical protein